MASKIAENDVCTSRVNQFAVFTTWPRLGTTSRVEGTRHVCCLVSKGVRLQQKRLRWSFIPLYECGKLIMYSVDQRSIDQQTCETKFV